MVRGNGANLQHRKQGGLDLTLRINIYYNATLPFKFKLKKTSSVGIFKFSFPQDEIYPFFELNYPRLELLSTKQPIGRKSNENNENRNVDQSDTVQVG